VDWHGVMLSLTIWCVGIVVEALLLYRGVRAHLVQRYLNFYIYALSLFLADGVLMVFYYARPALYARWTWYAGFMVLFLGCGVILEVFRQVLSAYAGAEKLARLVSSAVFGAIICFAIVYPIWSPKSSVAQALYVVVQRDFLFAQALILLVLLQVISYYGIPMGRNLKGMVLGYGQCIGVTLITLAVRAYLGAGFQEVASTLQQMSYLAALAVWLMNLWSYCGNPVPEATIAPDADYDQLASRTRDMVATASTQLVKVERL
jgi:hypothetical protein